MTTGRRMAELVFLTVLALSLSSHGHWYDVLRDPFDPSSTNNWRFLGLSNAADRAMLRINLTSEVAEAEWDQSNVYVGAGDPYTITPSRLHRPLGRCLTDRDTFRFGVTLNIASGSVPDTTEFYNTGNVGLYGLSQMGPDRAMADNWSFNTTILKDGSDFVEFNYWIGNNPAWGQSPSAEVTMGAHIDGVDGDYYFNWASLGDPMWHSTAMPSNWLPEDTNLYVEVTYHGAATNGYARRAYGAIYADAARTSILSVDDVDLYFWTVPLPSNKTFALTDVAFYNYVAGNWGGVNGAGRGTFDDLYVEQFASPGEVFAGAAASGGVILTWAAVSGQTYRVEACTDLVHGVWTLVDTVQTTGDTDTITFTNPLNGVRGWYRVNW